MHGEIDQIGRGTSTYNLNSINVCYNGLNGCGFNFSHLVILSAAYILNTASDVEYEN